MKKISENAWNVVSEKMIFGNWGWFERQKKWKEKFLFLFLNFECLTSVTSVFKIIVVFILMKKFWASI